MPTVTLLGPQRLTPTLAAAVARSASMARMAAVTAGWQEREDEDRRAPRAPRRAASNLRLYQRAEEVFQRDPELARALRERQERLRELQELYRSAARHAMMAPRELRACAPATPSCSAPSTRRRWTALRELDRAPPRARTPSCTPLSMRACSPRSARRSFAAPRRARRASPVAAPGDRGRPRRGAPQSPAAVRHRALLRGRPLFAWSAGAMAVCRARGALPRRPPAGRGQRRGDGRGARPRARHRPAAARPAPAAARRPGAGRACSPAASPPRSASRSTTAPMALDELSAATGACAAGHGAGEPTARSRRRRRRARRP